MDHAQRQALGIHARVPSSIEEALDALNQDQGLRHLMGEEMYDLYIRLKKKEDDPVFKLLSDEERRQKFTKIY